jgi:4'-phosphopantetheinyl transferase
MHSLLELPPGEIHLWLSFYDEITDERLLASYRDLLVAEEAQQEQRFYFAKDRRRYLVTRAMVRTVLSRYVSMKPSAWIFSIGAYGRPEIANVKSGTEHLSFNLSHTDGLIVLGVTKHREIGVDVENFTAREISIDIADHFFSSEEVAALALVPKYQQQYRFFEYWTFKEAYIKARGMGLFLPLDKFSFHYPREGAVDMTIRPEMGDDSSRWQFCQFRPMPQYLVAVCTERIVNQPAHLVIRKIVPAADEEMLAHVFTRQSKWT